jgi:ribosomal subunit interface protein
MDIKVSGSNIETGQALVQYVEENLPKSVTKYFENAVSAQVHFAKSNQMFEVVITVNEGVKGGITVKSDAKAGDVYGCFTEAAEKCAKQLRRYKRRIKNYRHNGGGIKASEPDYSALDAKKYILPPVPYNVFDEMESEETASADEAVKIVDEKTTDIDELTVQEAIMKMDLQNLPALVFTNSENKRLNVVYHRKDGNISWIDPKA